MKKIDQASGHLEYLIKKNPNSPVYYNDLGYIWADNDLKLAEAEKLIRKAIELDRERRAKRPKFDPKTDQDNGAYLDSLGWALFKRGDLVEAQKYLDAAANRMPRNSEVQDHLGDVFARQGRVDDAIAAWTRALEGDASDVDLAEIRRKINDARSKSKR
jgi:tetratricopeptide (TPR) repeat protein